MNNKQFIISNDVVEKYKINKDEVDEAVYYLGKSELVERLQNGYDVNDEDLDGLVKAITHNCNEGFGQQGIDDELSSVIDFEINHGDGRRNITMLNESVQKLKAEVELEESLVYGETNGDLRATFNQLYPGVIMSDSDMVECADLVNEKLDFGVIDECVALALEETYNKLKNNTKTESTEEGVA